MCVILLFLSLCLSVIVYLCFALPVALCGSLILDLSLCLSACLPPSISHFLTLPLSLNPSSSTSSPSLSVSPPVRTTPSPQPEPRWAPGLLWAPPFSIPSSGGELGRHRGGAATGRRSRTGGWGRQVRACGSQGARKGNQGSSADPPLPLPTSQSARNPRVLGFQP